MGNLYTVGPNEALIISGGCFRSKQRTVIGGWAWGWWLVTNVQRLSLELITLNPMIREMVQTAEGVPLTVTGVAQCKVIKEKKLLLTAAEQFLGKSADEIQMTILHTIEGHLRSILGTLTVEEVYRDRDQFAALVKEVASPDVEGMGIEIISFTISDVSDDVEYLNSLGKTPIALVKRDADVGIAEANRDAGIREAECNKIAMKIKYETDTIIEDNSRNMNLEKAECEQEIETAQAEAELAYEMQAAKVRQMIRHEEIEIDVVERKKQIEIDTQEVLRKERELHAKIYLPADAESYRVQTIAEGKMISTILEATAEAEKIKMISAAQAEIVALIGKAEAERMRKKAEVFKQFGNAAKLAIVLEKLPKVAATIASPLSKIEEIVILSGKSNNTSDVTKLIGQIPAAISALTNVDLSKLSNATTAKAKVAS